MIKPRLLLVGWGRCGKDCAAEFMDTHLGLRYCGSTSWSALPLMAEKLGQHPQMAWEHRHENRKLWKDYCDEFRRDNPLLLVQRALNSGGQVVTGIRDRVEILAAKEAKIFRNILWIDRYGVPVDSTVTFDASDATDYVKNDGDLRRFHCNLVRWAIQSGFPIEPSTYAAALLLEPTP